MSKTLNQPFAESSGRLCNPRQFSPEAGIGWLGYNFSSTSPSRLKLWARKKVSGSTAEAKFGTCLAAIVLLIRYPRTWFGEGGKEKVILSDREMLFFRVGTFFDVSPLCGTPVSLGVQIHIYDIINHNKTAGHARIRG